MALADAATDQNLLEAIAQIRENSQTTAFQLNNIKESLNHISATQGQHSRLHKLPIDSIHDVSVALSREAEQRQAERDQRKAEFDHLLGLLAGGMSEPDAREATRAYFDAMAAKAKAQAAVDLREATKEMGFEVAETVSAALAAPPVNRRAPASRPPLAPVRRSAAVLDGAPRWWRCCELRRRCRLRGRRNPSRGRERARESVRRAAAGAQAWHAAGSPGGARSRTVGSHGASGPADPAPAALRSPAGERNLIAAPLRAIGVPAPS